MMAVTVFLLLVSLLDSAKGVEKKFVKYKSDLLLNIDRSEFTPKHDFLWTFNQSKNVVKLNFGSKDPNIFDTRAEFFKQNYSLLLKNVLHNYTGSYRAVDSGSDDITITEYQVTVLDPVSPVKLTINSVVLNDCNVTVTCRTQDSLIRKTFQCNNITCSLVSNPDNTAASSTLNVYVQQDYIICNHSNQVSSEQDKIDFKAQCETKPARSAAIIARIAVSVLLVAITSPCVLYIYCKRKHSNKTVPESTNVDLKTPVGAAPDVSNQPNPVLPLKRLAQEEESRNHPAHMNRGSKPTSAAPTVNR